MAERKLTLPEDSDVRKAFPLFSGLFAYFPAALSGVAHHSWVGNAKHNDPDGPLYHSRWKSTDQEDCILRHLMDLADMRAMLDRGEVTDDGFIVDPAIIISELLDEANALAWRALALSQILHETYGCPVAPAAALTPEDAPNG